MFIIVSWGQGIFRGQVRGHPAPEQETSMPRKERNGTLAWPVSVTCPGARSSDKWYLQSLVGVLTRQQSTRFPWEIKLINPEYYATGRIFVDFGSIKRKGRVLASRYMDRSREVLGYRCDIRVPVQWITKCNKLFYALGYGCSGWAFVRMTFWRIRLNCFELWYSVKFVWH